MTRSEHNDDLAPLTPLLQELSQREWESMTAEQRAVKRSLRARAGCRCPSCGSVGYFRRNCPHCPPVVFSSESGDFIFVSPRKKKAGGDELVVCSEQYLGDSSENTRTTSDCRAPTAVRPRRRSFGIETWQKTGIVDSSRSVTTISGSVSSSIRDGGGDLVEDSLYGDRSRSSENTLASKGYLKQRGEHVLVQEHGYFLVLERLTQALEEALTRVISPFATSILRETAKGEIIHLPASSAAQKDDREFFLVELTEGPAKHDPKEHEYKGNYKDDAKLLYVFDRQYVGSKGDHLREHLAKGFKPAPKCYRGTAVHGIVGWRSTLTNLDKHATGGKNAEKALTEMQCAFQKQGKWLEAQKYALETRSLRCKHLLHVLEKEMNAEISREKRILSLKNEVEERKAVASAMQQRAASADRIMSLLIDYKLVGQLENAHYLQFTLNQLAIFTGRNAGWRNDAATLQTTPGHQPSIESLSSAEGPVPQKIQGQGGKGRRSDAHHNDGAQQLSPYASSIPRRQPYHRKNRQSEHGQVSPSSSFFSSSGSVKGATSRKETRMLISAFKQSHGNIRKGSESDTTATPALIPLPKSLAKMGAEDVEKSYIAEAIFYKARLQQIDPISGKADKNTLPLWYRHTDYQGGEQYASLL